MRIFLFLAFFIFSFSTSAQKIYGTVFTSQGDLLPYASITIKGTTKGASANEKAHYAINLVAGTYTIICQHLGYTTSEKTIKINEEDIELSFVLTNQKLNLETVVIKNKGEDPAYEIIRNAIKKRTYYLNQVEKFTCNIYGKDVIKLRSLPKKVFGQKIKDEDKKEMGVDSTGKGIMYLSESMSKASASLPNNFKMEVLSSRISGSSGFGFNFPPFISLYNNNVKIFTEKFNPRGFISPIAEAALNFYKYKFLGTIIENGLSISSIQVIPKRKYEPLFTGIINIVDEEWSIHSFNLMLTKTSQLELADTLQLTQLHVPVNNEIRRVKNQLIHFSFNLFGVKAAGNFLTVYSDYNVNPTFAKKYFDNVIIKYDTAVNKKTIAYWDSARVVPLEPEEEIDYKKKDSAFNANKDSLLSTHYLDSLNKKNNKIKPFNIFTSGIRQSHIGKTTNYYWGIDPLLYSIEYNTAEGIALNLTGYYSKTFGNNKKNITILPVLRYGFQNTHFNPSISLNYSTTYQNKNNKFQRYALSLSAGKRVSVFNKTGTYTALANSVSLLLSGTNYLKTYENYFTEIAYYKSFESGVRMAFGAIYEDRIPLNNTTNYTFKNANKSKITPNYPYEKLTTQFNAHKAFLLNFTISFKPGQKYMQLPESKISLGSKYPTLTFSYTKGVNNILGSSVNFDKWKFIINDTKNFKLAGSLQYKIGVGGFLNSTQVFIQDYQHFNGNQFLSASNYVNSFQLAPYYAYSTTAPLYTFAHIDHHLNGLLTNKIPLFKKLNWNIVAGTNAFYINKNNNYIEIFGGLENIFKLFRIDFVAGYEKNKISKGIRIGAGGLLGGSIGKKGGSINIDL
ncbi:MAG: DUF5686 and carboxypeptidase regulatory-like domain-containing protein [Ferruginibacter sp.]|nr:carboxypeptidase-like regulatory domain-containing protein [Ferruginibacter sp.]